MADGAPWRDGRKRQGSYYGQKGTWVFQPAEDNGGWQQGRRRRRRGGGQYRVCASCGHWEYTSHGHVACSMCGGAYLDGGGAQGGGVPPAAQGDGGPDAEVRAAAAKVLAFRPDLRDSLGGLAEQPAPPVAAMSAAQLDTAANVERTRLAKVAEDAARQVRLACQEVEQKRTKSQKVRTQLDEALDALREAEAEQASAEDAQRTANALMQEFAPEQWKLQKQQEMREAESARLAR